MSREVMQQALKAHEAAKDIVDGVPQWHNAGYAAQLIDASITALRAALAEQPASKERDSYTGSHADFIKNMALPGLSEQPATPQVLTDEEIIAIRKKTRATNCDPWGDTLALGRAILAAAIPEGHVVVPVGEVEALRKALTDAREVSQKLLGALEMLLRYTKACEALLNCKPAGQIEIAEAAIRAARPGGQG